MHEAVIEWFQKMLPPDIKGWNILEVGSYNINGSVKNILLNDPRRGDVMKYANYIGVDMSRQEWFVDIVLDASKLTDMFAANAFDMVIAAEVLEHCQDWKAVVRNLKMVTKNLLLITTRSDGFFYHKYNEDCWRYSLENMKEIFSDFTILQLEKDTEAPGVFMAAKKPISFIERDLSGINLTPADPNLKESVWREKI